MARHLDAGLELLDRQVVDADGRPVGKVDDLELAVDEDGAPPVVAALLIGPHALGARIGGRLGRAVAGIAARLAHTDQPLTVPMAQVEELGVVVRLGVSVDDLAGGDRLERWLKDQIVSRIPGGRRAAE